MFGVPHSLVITVSWPRCHQKSYASCWCPAVRFPGAQHVEGVVVEAEDAAGTAAVGCAQCTHVDGVGAAVHRVRRGVAGALRERTALDHLHDLRGCRGSGLVSTMWMRDE